MANKELGNKLKLLRLKNNYTQQQVADMIGIKNKSTLGSWEIGKSEPDAFTFLKLCQIYNVNDILAEFTDCTNMTTQDETIQLYNNLDIEDKAEIKGTIKQMLKANKYKNIDNKKIVTTIEDITAEIREALSKSKI